jgi:hypothetical protein
MLDSINSLGGQICFSCKYKKFIQVTRILETVGWDILKRYARSCSLLPGRKRINVIKSSSKGGNARRRPLLDGLQLLVLSE